MASIAEHLDNTNSVWYGLAYLGGVAGLYVAFFALLLKFGRDKKKDDKTPNSIFKDINRTANAQPLKRQSTR